MLSRYTQVTWLCVRRVLELVVVRQGASCREAPTNIGTPAKRSRGSTILIRPVSSMARTHSSHTGSPSRLRSPQPSPARRPSQDGSQYEMDLDALGLNSTFETTELDGGHEPPVDRIDTSEIEGPDDFTMNMTYWMTADLPLAHIKSRKEAHTRRSGPRMDAMQEKKEPEGARESLKRPQSTDAAPAAPERAHEPAPSERSMENDEKVRSFLSALPDMEMESALAGTPLHAQRHSFLQVPHSSPPKARSLQPTVEDYDTPRKPTQETVIRHTSAMIETDEKDAVRRQISELQSRLEQQESASKMRITELETILAHTRTELERARVDNYRNQESFTSLQRSLQEKDAERRTMLVSAEAQKIAGEGALSAKIEVIREEMRLQSHAKLESQQKNFDQKLTELTRAKQLVERELAVKEQQTNSIQKELSDLKHLREPCSQDLAASTSQIPSLGQLSIVQARATELQRELEGAIAEARVAREDAQHKDALRAAAEAETRNLAARVADLDLHLRTARLEIECAQADVAAKQQLSNINLDLNSQLRALRSELETTRATTSPDHQQTSSTEELERRICSLQTQLSTARAEMSERDQQIITYIEGQAKAEQQQHTSQGRIEGLEANQTALRRQLADAHREGARTTTDAERLQHDLENLEDRMRETQTEADRRVTDAEKRLSKMKADKIEAESRYKALQSQYDDLIEAHETRLADAHDNTEDALRKAGALLDQERSEKRRVFKDLKLARQEVETLRRDAAQKTIEGERSAEDNDTTSSACDANATAAEVVSLRGIIRRQVTESKAMKTEMAALQKENKNLKSSIDATSDHQATILDLNEQVGELRREKSSLQSRLEEQRAEFDAINRAMDEKLAAVVSKVMKERAKKVVDKRDGQWVETVGKVQGEKELLGKVLLRQWGREEVGIADEKHGERQGYAYKYVQR